MPLPGPICIFLGAGFSRVGGVPLASHLFDKDVDVDVVSRQRLIERVLSDWDKWHATKGGGPEEYLAPLQDRGVQKWRDAQWYVALAVSRRR